MTDRCPLRPDGRRCHGATITEPCGDYWKTTRHCYWCQRALSLGPSSDAPSVVSQEIRAVEWLGYAPFDLREALKCPCDACHSRYLANVIRDHHRHHPALIDLIATSSRDRVRAQPRALHARGSPRPRSRTMTTRVVNLRTDPSYDFYIGRAGRGHDGYHGNPYHVGATCRRCGEFHATGASTLSCFTEYFRDRLLDAEFRERTHAMQGFTLGCFCKPRPCHGDVIAEYLDSLTPRGAVRSRQAR